ncbi:MAG: WYL domain-containing transcriptional regulator [Ignavibacteriaceae bacterium]|nr:WYL domain-containing transcriptional regulator [Ignavibacteriaceae bacterium]
MLDNSESLPEFFRKIEILALAKNNPEYSSEDFAEYFNCSAATINRATQDIRGSGVPLHSRKGQLILVEQPNIDILSNLASTYLSLRFTGRLISPYVNAISKTNSEKFFEHLVLLAKACAEELKIEMIYKPLSKDEAGTYYLKPYELTFNEFNWVLYGVKEGEEIEKKFFVTRIQSLKLKNEKFDKIDFHRSTPNKEYKMVFKFNSVVSRELTDKIWFEDSKLEIIEDGSIILTVVQPLSNKLMSWCLTWWGNLEIIEPVELKEGIKKMINEYLKVNEKN